MTAQSAAPLSLVPSVPDVVGRIGATGRPGERLTVQLIAKSPDTKVARELLARLTAAGKEVLQAKASPDNKIPDGPKPGTLAWVKLSSKWEDTRRNLLQMGGF